MVDKLFKYLENHTNATLTSMLEALCGLLRNAEKGTNQDVEMYLKKHEGLIWKLNKVDPSHVSEAVCQSHLGTVERITKHFVEPKVIDYEICNDYLPLLTWTTRFISLCNYARGDRLINEAFEKMKVDMADGESRIKILIAIKEAMKTNTITRYIYEDSKKDAQNTEIIQGLRLEVDGVYLDLRKLYEGHYEKYYFNELEQDVIKKRLGSKMRKLVLDEK